MRNTRRVRRTVQSIRCFDSYPTKSSGRFERMCPKPNSALLYRASDLPPLNESGGQS